MEGVVDHHLRHLLTRLGGIDLCVTEFVRVTDHALPRKVFLRYSPELDPQSRAPAALCPTRVQLLGSNATALAENAARAAQLGAPGIDLNFGCPAKTVNKNRGGACLLDEPRTLYEIVSAVRDRVPTPIPVTAKIRLGYADRKGYLDTAQAIFDAGASELVVHARSKADAYRPPAYWECIAEIRQQLPLRTVANGEIWNLADYRRCVEICGCSDVMLGRGLLATPDLALQIKAYHRGENYLPRPWSDIAAMALDFFEMTSTAYPAKYLGNRVKQWLHYLSRQYPEARNLFTEIKRSRDYCHIRTAIKRHALGQATLSTIQGI